MIGYPVKKKECAEIDRLRRIFNVKPKEDEFCKNPESWDIYLEDEEYLYIPKYWGIKTYGPLDFKTKSVKMTFYGKLRDYQYPIVDKALFSLNNPKERGCILNIGCGLGKTCMALYIISKMACKTMIMVHKGFLLDQWRQRINEFLPHVKVGIIQGSNIDTSADIILCSIQTIIMPNKKFCNSIGMMVIDECHHASAKMFCKVFQRVNPKYSLGLTATPNRKDGLSDVFIWNIGPLLTFDICRNDAGVHVDMYEYYAIDNDYDTEHYMYNGKLNMAKMTTQICDYMPRTNFIVDIITRYVNTSRKILVMSERRKHLEIIKKLLDGVYSCGLYYGGMKQSELKKSESCKVILASYAMSTEGLDIKDLDTLVLASPKSDVVQTVGRILRTMPEDRINNPLIIDICDAFSIFAYKQFKRKEYYLEQNYTIKYHEYS